MNKQRKEKKLLRYGRVLGATVRTGALIFLVIFGSFAQPARVFAAQTADQYCAAYIGIQSTACKDGIRGQDCSAYGIIADQQTAGICNNAAGAVKSGQVTGTPSTTTSPTGNTTTDAAQQYKQYILNACAPYQSDTAAALWCLYGGLGQNGTAGVPQTVQDCLTKPELQGLTANQNACITGANAGQAYQANKSSTTTGSTSTSTSNGSSTGSGTNSNSLQGLLGQVSTLSQFINALHLAGPNSGINTSNAADNNYGSYVNGAGQQQPINVIPSGQKNSPAIIFLNGGGWHGDDGTHKCVAAGASGYHSSCSDGGKGASTDGSPAVAPAGGGATKRGYTVIEVTYRLGSSGIYYMYEDVLRGIRHVINNAGQYGIDPGKIALWGDSAGASLATRAAASGKSGAKVAVGWSSPTNAYTAMFKSFSAFAIAIDHSTCIPTDLAGLTNATSLLNGGSGNVAQYGQGIASNDFSSLGIGSGSSSGGQSNPLSTITQVLTAAQDAAITGQNVESISQQLQKSSGTGSSTGTSSTSSAANNLGSLASGLGSVNNTIKSLSGTPPSPSPSTSASSSNPLGSLLKGAGISGGSGLSGGIFNLSTAKLTECLANLNDASPALGASPSSPPMFLAGYDTDDIIGPDQELGMRDKLRSLGVKSEALILKGNPNGGGGGLGPKEGNHLGYDAKFLCDSLNFVDSIIQPDKKAVDCAKGNDPNANNCTSMIDKPFDVGPTTSGKLTAATIYNAPPPPPPTNDTVIQPAPHPYYDGGTSFTPGSAQSGPYTGPIGGATKANDGVYRTNNANTLNTPSNTSTKSSGGGTAAPKPCPSPSGAPGSGSPAPGGASPRPSSSTNPLGGLLGGQCGNSLGGNQFGNQYGSPYGSQYGSPYGNQYGSPYGSQCGNNQTSGLTSLINQLSGTTGSSPIGNLGGVGGISNPTSIIPGTTASTTPSTANNQVQTTGVGTPGDFTGDRGAGTPYVEGKRSGNCTIDWHNTPEAATSASALVDICAKQLGNIENVTSATYHLPPIQLVFIHGTYEDSAINIYNPNPCMTAIAFAMPAQGRVYVCADQYNKDGSGVDAGVIVHETAHLTQAYAGTAADATQYNAPTWFLEGVADYVRTQLGYDNPNQTFSTGNTYGCKQNDYTAGYKCADALYRYIQRTYNKPTLIHDAHAAANRGNYSDSLLTNGTGKTLTQLYDACLSAECQGGNTM